MISIKRRFNKRDLELFSDKEKDILAKTVLEDVSVSRHKRELKISLLTKETLTDQIISKIKEVIFRHLPQTVCASIHCCDLGDLGKGKRLIKKAWRGLLECLFTDFPVCRVWLQGSYWELKGNFLNIYLEPSGIEFLKKHKICSVMEKKFIKFGYPLKIIFKTKPEVETNQVCERERELIKSILKENASHNTKSNISPSSPYLIGKPISSTPTPICHATKETGRVTFSGEIFDIKKRNLKNKSIMLTFGLTDYTGSIAVKIFLSGKQKSIADEFKEGLWLKTRGNIEKNNYTQEYELIPSDVCIIQKPERMDDNPEKRVELHLHTRYSSMDALCSPKEVLNTAKKWGHKAVAFTDHGVLQAFPEIYRASKEIGVKPIYGLEAYVFDDEKPVMLTPANKSIKDTIFVVVDIETTGLCFDKDDIIEIGAVKILNNKIIDKFSSFIKPKRPIPPNITKLTGITNHMVESAKPIECVLPSFLRFLDDGVFVAHNAEFDSGFIRREASKLGLHFDNDILDTLALARIVFFELKNHRLNTLAKELNIKMGSHHRAFDDASTTAKIFKKLLEQTIESGIINLRKINDIYKLQRGVPKLNSYHATILVKNSIGLRNLYKLVSISHLKYYYRYPRIPKSLLRNHREGLLIGSGCQEGELFQSLLHFASHRKIKSILEFYDFLEIQPLHNNAFLIDNGYVSKMERLKELNREICHLGKTSKKPVVATGDVHFINPEEEVFRKILLHSKGFRNADKESKLYFKTTKEMLSECKYLGEDLATETVIKNPNMIADEVEDGIKPFPNGMHPPKIPGAGQKIIDMTFRQAKALYGEKLPDIVESRIQYELDSIVNNGYAVIYLIAHKLVKKSMEDGYLVGSRGSVGSSLVATMCKITEVNPLPAHYLCPKCKMSIFEKNSEGIVGPDLPDKDCPNCASLMNKEGFNIPFEVFMGFKGDKVPDIDLNFSGEYQSMAHKHAEELFGKDHVFRAGTISTVAQKTAFGFVKTYLEEKGLNVPNIEIRRLASGITGVKRTTSQHPGGLIVVPRNRHIYEFTPIQYPAGDKRSGVITTHFEYHSIGDQLLKLDLLGHDDPTVIRMLEEETGVEASKIPLDDTKTMELFSSSNSLDLRTKTEGTVVGSLGVPEFGTRFVRQMLEDTRPTSFSELVRISGLSHGTDVWLNNAKDIIKSNFATLKDVIATRDDIMIYLMDKGVDSKIAFHIMENVRKGKGLKPEHENILIKNKSVDPWFVESCKKIKYLFPKAHAVAYVVMAFRIAYFKVHHPEAFYAAYFTARANDFDAELILQGPDKIKDKMLEIQRKEKEATAKEKSLFTILEVVNEMYMRGFHFTSLDLYKSSANKFKITKNGILPPISVLQGIGVTAAENIVRERNKAKFTSIEDLRRRTKITQNVTEILRKNGMLNGLQETDQLSLFGCIK